MAFDENCSTNQEEFRNGYRKRLRNKADVAKKS